MKQDLTQVSNLIYFPFDYSYVIASSDHDLYYNRDVDEFSDIRIRTDKEDL